MKRFNVGVLGVGDISDVYIDNLKAYDVVNVVACAGRNREKASRKAEAWGLKRSFESAEELIVDPEIDIVLNLTPPAMQAKFNLAALEAGKHVYSEKPLAPTYDEGKRILALANERRLLACCAPDTFLGGRLQTCRKLIDDRSIGEVAAASAFVVTHGPVSFHPDPESFYGHGAGPLLDIGPYYVTALVSLLGPARSCAAMSKRTFDRRVIQSEPRKGGIFNVDVDTHVSASIEFDNGVVATLVASFDVWDSELPRAEIYGTRGTICLRDIDPLDGPNLFGGAILIRDIESSRWKELPRRQPLLDWREVPVEHRFNEVSHRKNSRGIGLVDMVYALMGNRQPRASANLALHCLEVMDGILTSAAEHRFYECESRCERPEPLPIDYPDSEYVG